MQHLSAQVQSFRAARCSTIFRGHFTRRCQSQLHVLLARRYIVVVAVLLPLWCVHDVRLCYDSILTERVHLYSLEVTLALCRQLYPEVTTNATSPAEANECRPPKRSAVTTSSSPTARLVPAHRSCRCKQQRSSPPCSDFRPSGSTLIGCLSTRHHSSSLEAPPPAAK